MSIQTRANGRTRLSLLARLGWREQPVVPVVPRIALLPLRIYVVPRLTNDGGAVASLCMLAGLCGVVGLDEGAPSVSAPGATSLCCSSE
jgi:hypothetical protein